MRSLDAKTERLVTAGILTAAVLVLTLVSFPGGMGYLNAGDAAVLLTGTLLGGGWGCVCAAAGSALADLLLGYTIYIPCTVVVKALASLLARLLTKKLPARWMMTALVLSSMIIGTGYFLYEWALFGIAIAAGNMAGNFAQGFVGAVVAYILTRVIRRFRSGRNKGGDSEELR